MMLKGLILYRLSGFLRVWLKFFLLWRIFTYGYPDPLGFKYHILDAPVLTYITIFLVGFYFECVQHSFGSVTFVNILSQ